jgi:hypothetical protein
VAALVEDGDDRASVADDLVQLHIRWAQETFANRA